MKIRILSVFLAGLISIEPAGAWGLRGHTVANLAAVETLPGDELGFLKRQKAYVGHLGTIPDTWRSPADAFLRISEDPNHGWYTEEFDFIKEIPRSRTEFTLRVYDEYLRVSRQDPVKARLLNIRYTGLQAYSMMEGYERMKAGMRLYRLAGRKDRGSRFADISGMYAAASKIFTGPDQVRDLLAIDIAFYMGWLGHYIADAAMPLHNSKHHDGWSGENPKGYTRDPEIHGRFESAYVDMIGTSEEDVLPFVRKEARHLTDPWMAILDHMIEARNSVEDVYRLDLRNAFKNPKDEEARALVYKRLGSGAGFLRDLAYTAWIESGKPMTPGKPIDLPNNPDNPRYNPATGSAPAPK